MSRRMTSIGTLAAVFCILIISATPAMATDVAQRSQVAQIDVRSTGISWQPLINFKSAVLTVSGPDGAFLSREFNRGESIQMPVVDKQGNAFADGGYSWELSFAPVLEPAVKRALQDARESGDERAVADLKRQGKLPEGAVVSGYFRVRSGSIITPDKAESSAAVERTVSEPDMGDASSAAMASAEKDQVILDDLIVDGSICVGLDCVNGESFGFDTLRLKENNLRIKAQDTSVSASFPTNDWQITFNDSSNGGANKFSIDDIDGGRTPFTIEAGARSNALYVESDGDIGIGTNNPVVDVHIKSGNTPTLRLEQDGSSGFTPQTWDVAGNEANFFIRDATNGSTLPFRIFPSAPSDALNIEGTTGDIGIGTTTPGADLDIESSTGPGVRLTNTGSGGGTWDLFVNANTSRLNVEFNDGNIPLKIDDGANNNLLQLGTNGSDQVDITGNLVISGSCSDSGGPGCDAVFQPEYPLESLEEHAAFMWKNSYLPGVGPTPEDARWDLGRKSAGMLNELEKAHIYIEQLSATIADLQNRLEKLENGANE